MAKTRWQFPMVSANLTTVKVVECAEIVDSEVEIVVECAGCAIPARAWGSGRREAYKRLREQVSGWGVIFDRDVNDGEYPYCPACIKSIFPKLQARLRASVAGTPLPPHNPEPPACTESEPTTARSAPTSSAKPSARSSARGGGASNGRGLTRSRASRS